MSELDDIRRELTDLRATMNAGFLATDRHIRRQAARDQLAREREAEALLIAAPLAGQRWHTRQGSYIESGTPGSTPLLDRLRSDYAYPAGSLDRLPISATGLFDADNALDVGFLLPGTDYDVYEFYVGIFLRQFYATAKAAAAGGSSAPTSGSSSSSSSGPSSASSSGASDTSSSGPSSSSSSGASSNTSSGASDTSSSSNNAAASSQTTTAGSAINHTHDVLDFESTNPTPLTFRGYTGANTPSQKAQFNSNFTGTLKTASGGVSHDHGMSHTHSHSHNIDHTHTIAHTHGISHTHNIAHTHGIPHTHNIDHTHTVTIASHSHSLDFGIYKEAMPASWSVRLYLYELVTGVWTLRFTSDPITDLQDEVDLSAYVTGAGYWQVSVKSDAAQPNNGRLSAQVYGTVVGAIRNV